MNKINGVIIVAIHPGTQPRADWYLAWGSQFYCKNGKWSYDRTKAKKFPSQSAASEFAAFKNIKITN